MSYFRKIFVIPIDKKSRKEAEKIIEDTKEKINLGYGDYWVPTKENFPITSDVQDKSKETNSNRDDIKVSEECTFVDWNKFSMDELADYLESKWMFSSSGEAFAINKMIDFYRKNKEK